VSASVPEADLNLLIAIVGRLREHVALSSQLADDAMEVVYRLHTAETKPEPDLHERLLAALRVEVLGVER
jgi:hypothetical protein